jgi:hypothetical protein
MLSPARHRQGCPTSGHYLNNMDLFTGFHGKKLKWEEIEEIETRKEV